MRHSGHLLALLVVLVGVQAGCGGSGETTTVTVTTTTTTTESKPLPIGPAVVELQQVMTTLGYYSGPIDGVYGDATATGVKAMQEDLGVTPDGIYGPETHNALNQKAKGAASSITVQIQTVLATYGYYHGEIDGDYGSATQDAVKQLQTDLGVTPDGRIGPETVSAFNEAVASGNVTPP